MSRGVVICAHNNELVDYVKMASVCANLARARMNVPITLITDSASEKYVQPYQNSFDNVVVAEELANDGHKHRYKMTDGNTGWAKYSNHTRSQLWELSPYDHTLAIDSDYMILDDAFSDVWNSEHSFMMNRKIVNIADPDNHGIHRVGNTIPMYWATVMFFKRNEDTERFFSVLNYVRDNFAYYSRIFNYSTRLYRNDFAYSVANHLMSACVSESYPWVSPFTRDRLFFGMDSHYVTDVNEDGLHFSWMEKDTALSASISSSVHIMNKMSLMDNLDQINEYHGAK